MHSPDQFDSIPFLEQHIRHTMAFYDGRCVDPAGGFFHFFMDDGSVYDRRTRHLVSSARFVINYAKAGRHFGRADYVTLARHGLDFIEQVHYQPATGGYAWLLRDGAAVDATNHCYGLCFVILAYAEALKAGVAGAGAGLARAYAQLTRRFWSKADGLLADEYNADFSALSPYRGQNANMHGCEALICAYEASGEAHYLERALTIADNVTRRLAGWLVAALVQQVALQLGLQGQHALDPVVAGGQHLERRFKAGGRCAVAGQHDRMAGAAGNACHVSQSGRCGPGCRRECSRCARRA